MNDIKVSILVPVYSAEKYISRCARSLFGQTYDNIEFVFVNDCTPDSSIEILKSVLKDYPKRQSQTKIINHDKNRGVAAARNTLLDNATGDYILWVDADDFIEYDTVQRLVKEIESSDIDILCFKSVKHSQKGIKIYSWEKEKNLSEFLLHVQQKTANTALWGRLIKRSLFTENKINFIEGINIGEDLLVLFKLIFFAKKIVTCDDVLYHRDYTNENSLVHMSRTPQKLKKQLENTKHIESFLKDKLDASAYINIQNINTYLLFIYNACLAGNKRSYHVWKKRADLLKTNTHSTENIVYRFFLESNNYYVNRIWALCIRILAFLRKFVHRFI